MKQMNKDIVIIGHGEIGSSIAEVEKQAGNNVFVRDLYYAEENASSQYAACHICIPYEDEESFIQAVLEHIEQGINADVYIIHSTVEVGTTSKIYDKGIENVVHSFVRGVHPNLARGLLTFEKPIGAITIEAAVCAYKHFESIGIKPRILYSPESSELGKLLSTTYYGYNILFAKMANGLCKELGLDYHDVYTWANETYNKGYMDLDQDNVIRPVLDPPEGKIGGHCIGPNFKLLPEGDLKEFCLRLNEKDV